METSGEGEDMESNTMELNCKYHRVERNRGMMKCSICGSSPLIYGISIYRNGPKGRMEILTTSG